jgi:hypothetical protein
MPDVNFFNLCSIWDYTVEPVLQQILFPDFRISNREIFYCNFYLYLLQVNKYCNLYTVKSHI